MDKGHFLWRRHSPPLHSSPREQMNGNTTVGRREGGYDVSHQWGSVGIISPWNFSSLLCSCTSWSLHPPLIKNSNTDAKQGQKSLRWQGGSMGAWGGRWWERKWNHTATNFWACSKTQRVLENGWERIKEWEICDILIRDIKEGAGDLETPAFWSQRLF